MANEQDPGSPGRDPQADAWLDVLAGRQPPETPDQQRAAALRRQIAAELDTPSGAAAAAAREQRRKRLQNLMEAAAPAAPALPAAPKRPAGLLAWLLPTPASGWRWAGALAGVMGVAVLVGQQLGRDDTSGDEAAVPKGLPGPALPGAVEAVPALSLQAADPLVRATALAQDLRTVGAQAEVLAFEGRAVIEARVPPERASAVRSLLAAQGLAWNGTGVPLRIEIDRARQPR